MAKENQKISRRAVSAAIFLVNPCCIGDRGQTTKSFYEIFRKKPLDSRIPSEQERVSS
jgi:hypothetical protein